LSYKTRFHIKIWREGQTAWSFGVALQRTECIFFSKSQLHLDSVTEKLTHRTKRGRN